MKEQFFSHSQPSGLAIVEDFYSENELKLIWEELEALTKDKHLLPPERTGTSRDNDNRPKKNNEGMFLDEFYHDRNTSNILRINRKLWTYLDSKHKELDEDPTLRYVLSSNEDTTLISYYTNGHYYLPHIDKASYTVLSYFCKEPKRFKGGNLKLLDYNMEIEIKNNMIIYLPSVYAHEVTPIIMDKDDGCSGRYCMSQFLFIGSHRP